MHVAGGSERHTADTREIAVGGKNRSNCDAHAESLTWLRLIAQALKIIVSKTTASAIARIE
jgi:hypothetical protein